MGEISIEMKLSILIMYPVLESKDKTIMKWFLTKKTIWKTEREYRESFGILSFNPGFSPQLVV